MVREGFNQKVTFESCVLKDFRVFQVVGRVGKHSRQRAQLVQRQGRMEGSANQLCSCLGSLLSCTPWYSFKEYQEAYTFLLQKLSEESERHGGIISQFFYLQFLATWGI